MSLPPAYDVFALGYGCMRIAADPNRGRAAVRAAFEAGYRVFDHADIYGGGASEEVFADVMHDTSGMRDAIVLQTKIGIRGDPARYDFDPDYLTEAFDGCLRRLRVDHVDVLLLHRIDLLADAAAVGAWLDRACASGKTKHVGVSNCTPSQLRMLQAHCAQPLCANQVEINLDRIDPFIDGTLDQCQELDVRPQAWCPLAGIGYPPWGAHASESQWQAIRTELARQSERYGLAPAELALAWLLRHPARIMPLLGSTSPERIRSAVGALEADYTHADWYRLLEARRGMPMP